MTGGHIGKHIEQNFACGGVEFHLVSVLGKVDVGKGFIDFRAAVGCHRIFLGQMKQTEDETVASM